MRASSLPRAAIFVALLALAGSALPAPSAEAQTAAAHVSNLGQLDSGPTGHSPYHAVSFTTGGTTGDVFPISDVVLDVHSFGTFQGTVGIYADSSGGPGAQVGANLVFQGGHAGRFTFNAPSSGITLAGGTTYWLRTFHSSANNLRQTASDNEDAGSTIGWSIGDGRRTSHNGSTWSNDGNTLRFRINSQPSVAPGKAALADAWGLTESAPASEPEDAWDGSARGCRHNGRGYYNLAGAPARWHGLGMGCHTHGQGHHEHGREKH